MPSDPPALPPPAPDDFALEDGTHASDLLLRDLDLRGTTLQGVRLEDCVLRDCDLTEARLRGWSLSGCRVLGGSWAAVDPTGCEAREIAFEGVRAPGVPWGQLESGALPPGLDFDGCDLSWGSFVRVDLAGRALRGCRLIDVRFSEADLRGADLSGSDLEGAAFLGCDLREADLRRAAGYRIDVRSNEVGGMRASLPEAVALLTGLGIALE